MPFCCESLPVANPSELYRVGDVENCCVNGGLQDDWSLFSYDKYKTFRDQTSGFTELAAFQAGRDLVGVRRGGTNQPAQSLRPSMFRETTSPCLASAPMPGACSHQKMIAREPSRSS